MQAVSTLICLALVVQSFGLSAPCRCDMGGGAAVSDAATGAADGATDVAGAPAADPHACCHGGGTEQAKHTRGASESAATDAADQADERRALAAVSGRCAEGCGCGVVAPVASLAEARFSAPQPTFNVSPQPAPMLAGRAPSPSAVAVSRHVRWRHAASPDELRRPWRAARRLAALQRWRC